MRPMPLWGVIEYPDIESYQRKVAALEEMDWWRYVSTRTVLGTKAEDESSIPDQPFHEQAIVARSTRASPPDQLSDAVTLTRGACDLTSVSRVVRRRRIAHPCVDAAIGLLLLVCGPPTGI